MIKTFHDIVAWQKAHELVLLTYKLTEQYPKTEIFGLASQSRRCAVSVPSNIAEGYTRKSRADCLHFYRISDGSLEELKYQLLLARDLGYISDSQYSQVLLLAEEVGRLLNGWKKTQK
ncbi:MAG: four helix bundle protein [Candidatus Doudnabacteria bacterium]|nr:four helix bundle protein [Candidatus Doudnabacteria bacterium]